MIGTCQRNDDAVEAIHHATTSSTYDRVVTNQRRRIAVRNI